MDDEQVRSGYSLAQQIEALRAYAAGEGYDIIPLHTRARPLGSGRPNLSES